MQNVLIVSNMTSAICEHVEERSTVCCGFKVWCSSTLHARLLQL